MKKYYYWIDTDYHYGDFSVPKFAFSVEKLLMKKKIAIQKNVSSGKNIIIWTDMMNV